MIRSAHRAVSAVLLVCFVLVAEDRFPGPSWDRAASVEKLGWSPEKLKVARQYADSIGSAAVVIVEDGLVIDQWGEITQKFNLHSIRKSFLSALYGIHVRQGRIRLDKTLEQLGIDDNPPSLTAAEKRATIRDLLKSRSGVYHPTVMDVYFTPADMAARPARGGHAPNAFWYYNVWDANVLGTIFEQETKTRIFEELKRRIADPTGMEDYRVEDGQYFTGRESIHRAYNIRMSARDMARFGHLFLRAGKWRGKTVVPEDWVRESTKSYSETPSGAGYGYLWWVGGPGAFADSYWALGAGGHYIVVYPGRNLVIVHRTDYWIEKDPRGRPVSGQDFERLLQRILAAKTR